MPLSFLKMIRGPFVSTAITPAIMTFGIFANLGVLILLERESRHPKLPICASVHCGLVIANSAHQSRISHSEIKLQKVIRAIFVLTVRKCFSIAKAPRRGRGAGVRATGRKWPRVLQRGYFLKYTASEGRTGSISVIDRDAYIGR
jgi:hypothetical protein